MKICDPAQQLPQPDKEACKKGETGQEEKEKEGKGMEEWKKKKRREESKGLENRRKTVL